jgi:hypothetical protein
MRSLFDDKCRRELLARFEHLRPDAAPLWGRMSAPQMVNHLGDQMRLTLGEAPLRPRKARGPWRYPGLKHVALYVLPWPKDRIRGPREAFVTQPTDWQADLAALEALVARFVTRGPGGEWPAHPFLGPLSGRQWGVFCVRHFDHHLNQFGV